MNEDRPSLRSLDRGGEGEGRSVNVARSEGYSAYGKWITTLTIGTIGLYFPVREDITKHDRGPYLLACLVLLCFTLSVSLAPMWPTSCLLRGCNPRFLIHTATVSMMLTSVSFLLLLNQSYAMVIIPVLPVMAIVIIVFYKGNNTGQDREVTDYEAQQSELKEFFDLSAPITSSAFLGMISTVLGHFKSSSIDQADVKISVAFIFINVIFGLLAMQLTTVPPSLPDRRPSARSHFITFIKFLCYSLFGLAALTGLAVAAEVLEEFTLLVFIPIFFALMVWFTVQFILQEDRTSEVPGATNHEIQLNTSFTFTALSFLALMNVYSGYLGGGENAFHLKTCVFFLSWAFMSSLSYWMLLKHILPRTRCLEIAVMILFCSTIGSLAVAVLDLIFFALPEGKTKRQP